jgi:tetratricopeptide (TPR) repeat protein
MRGWLTAGLLLLGGCSSVPSAPPAPSAIQNEPITPPVPNGPPKQNLEKIIDYYSDGLELMRKAEASDVRDESEVLYESALNKFKTSEKRQNKPYESMVQQAECLARLWETDKAFELINKVLKQKETSQAYAVRSIIYYNVRNIEKSVEDCTQAIKLDNSNADAFWTRATAYLRTESKKEILEKAQEDIKKYIELRPNEPDGPYLLSNVLKIILYKEKNLVQNDIIRKEYFKSLKNTLDIIDGGTEFRRGMFLNSLPYRRAEYEKHVKDTK